jgi:predicted nucleic acid-binding protein
MPVLVDSSLWVHQLRKSGDADKRARVEALLQAGAACWCPPVRLELWRGVATDADRRTLRRYEALLPNYDITPDVWEGAVALAGRGRAAGLTVPLADLLVFACATAHQLEIAHDDSHFDQLARLAGVGGPDSRDTPGRR